MQAPLAIKTNFWQLVSQVQVLKVCARYGLQIILFREELRFLSSVLIVSSYAGGGGWKWVGVYGSIVSQPLLVL